MGKSYVLLKYTGSDRYVEIPKYYNGYPVTSVGASAFDGNLIIENLLISSNIAKN